MESTELKRAKSKVEKNLDWSMSFHHAGFLFLLFLLQITFLEVEKEFAQELALVNFCKSKNSSLGGDTLFHSILVFWRVITLNW